MKTIARWVWDFTEWWEIPLGRLAPWVFGTMVGAKPVLKSRKDDE